MTRVLHRAIAHNYPVAVSGSGIHIRDAAGKHYIDASGGAAVSCLGHGHPDVLAAMHAQLDKLAYAHTSFFTTQVAEELADDLIAHAPQGIGHVYFVSGGSEAIEAALKMARQYFVETRRAAATPLHRPPAELSRQHAGCLGGRRQRMAAQAVRAAADRGASRLAVLRVSRTAAGRDAAGQYGERLAAGTRRQDQRTGPRYRHRLRRRNGRSARRLGAFPPVPGYFKRVREICDRHGILLILDEVMCGMGRTGTLHACEQEGIAPDLMAIAKGLGGGFAPIGAVLVQSKIFEAFAEGLGPLPARPHLPRPSAGLRRRARRAAGDPARQPARQCAPPGRASDAPAATSASATTITSATCAAAACSGPSSWWRTAAARRRSIPRYKLHARIKQQAMARGLMVYPMGGTIDGVRGDHVLLAPPFIVDARRHRYHRRAARRCGRCGDCVAELSTHLFMGDKAAMAWRIGVDIGGTFTDVALVDDASGRIGVAKVPTTPRDFAEGVLAALEHGDAALRHRRRPTSGCCRMPPRSSPTPSSRRRARAPRSSPRAAFATCWSCGARRAAISTTCSRIAPATLIPRRRRFEITERIGADGAVVTPLAEGEIDGLIAALKAARVRGDRGVAAVQLPQSGARAEARRAAARGAARTCPSISRREVLPEIREFERTSTTAVCAYVGPILASYLARLESATHSRGPAARST